MKFISKDPVIHLQKSQRNSSQIQTRNGGHTAEKINFLSGKVHKSLSVKQRGLFLDKDYPFFVATLDRIVNVTATRIHEQKLNSHIQFVIEALTRVMLHFHILKKSFTPKVTIR